ncbi:alpha/beta fold hydrolase [Lentibacter algarum]|uniref:alpha/beta hydrolase family protein n=1 Tax=Lentibacter algarum TaxID=576131 RepID=UPI001C081D4D|nr:alpha/beta fold hydrolase [Lentibacter algarum]MBU2982941.1 alpha/beta fold hydrolase [Lentibacter algarum]
MAPFNVTASVLAICLSASTALADTLSTGLSTGIQQLEVKDASVSRPLSGFVWYPTEAKGASVMANGNPVFQAIPVQPDAEVQGGKHPLVVFSHGMYGNVRNQAWLASALTQKGYIVAAVDHPGTSSFSRDADQARELWQRPKDISRLIDHLLADESFAAHVDTSRIFMAGHSLGGFTAVALAGGRFSPEKVDAMCAAGEDDLICGILDGWNIAKTQDDRAAMAADLSDDRIKAFAVFDLGATQVFSPESLAAINAPLQIWGAPEDIAGMNLDLESRALKAALSEGVSEYHEPEGMAHFDFLGECTAKGLMILKEEEPEDAFICIDGTEPRRALHQMIAEKTEGFFADQ